MFSYVITTKSFWAYKSYIYLMAFTACLEGSQNALGHSANGLSHIQGQKEVLLCFSQAQLKIGDEKHLQLAWFLSSTSKQPFIFFREAG